MPTTHPSQTSVGETRQSQAHHSQTKPLLMVLVCTLIGAAAQVLIKMGTASLGEHPSMMATMVGILTIRLLFAGYALYGISTVLLVLALRQGELSLLYPVFTLTYVWVTVLSVIIFHDSMNAFKLGGIAIIIAGVAVLGRASRK
jgi:multidrug transporter EmrE-like cation transporter